MTLDEVADDCQTDSQTSLRTIDCLAVLHKEIKDVRQHLRRDSDARIANAEHDVVIDVLRENGDLASRGGVLRRVCQQVRDHLAHSRRVGVDPQPAGRHVHTQCVGALLNERAGHLNGLRQDFREFHDDRLQFHLAAGDSGNVEEVVHKAGEMVDLALNNCTRYLRPIRTLKLHQFQRRQDG